MNEKDIILRKKAIEFEKSREAFVKDYSKREGSQLWIDRRGILSLSLLSSDFRNLQRKNVESFIETRLNNDYDLFDSMMSEWVRSYKERNIKTGNHKVYQEELFGQSEDILDRECYSYYPSLKPNFFLNNLSVRFREMNKMKNGLRDNKIGTTFPFSDAVSRALCFDLQNIVENFGINDVELVKKCTEFGTWTPSDEESRDQSEIIYIGLRELGYLEYDIWS